MDEMFNNILSGPELKLTNESFGQTLNKGLKNGGSKIAMVDAIRDKNVTYNEILTSSIILTEYLKNIGLTANDTISICSENNLNYCLPIISGLFLGIIVSPTCSELQESELQHVLKLAKPKIVFCSTMTIGKIMKISRTLNHVKIILLDHCSKEFPHYVDNIDNILKQTTTIIENFKITLVKPDHSALLLFSSGTTGLPKGVLHSHRSLLTSHYYNAHPDYGNFTSNKVGMGLAPFYFGFGFIRFISMLVSNMKIVILPKFRKRLFLYAIQKYRITNIYLTPLLVLFMAKSPLVEDYDLSSVQEIFCGASGLGKDVVELAVKRLNCNNIRQGYGLSETMAISILPAYNNRPGSVGKLVPGRKCKIIDPDTNEPLGPHQQGELCVKGPSIMKGYVDNPSATAEIIDSDGWLHTGDAAYYDDEGFIYIVDRYKELIKYKGFQVPPAELEDLLLKHSQVVDCAVVGKPDEIVGELPTAFVVKLTNSSITEDDLLKYVAKNVSYQKRLHGGVIFVSEIPKNPTGKILRRVLRQRLLLPTSKL